VVHRRMRRRDKEVFLAIMPFWKSASLSRDIARIGRRFNAGLRQESERVPEGRQKTGFWSRASAVAPGLWGLQPRDPALKRWAIVECPSGTDFHPYTRKAFGLANAQSAPRLERKRSARPAPDAGTEKRDSGTRRQGGEVENPAEETFWHPNQNRTAQSGPDRTTGCGRPTATQRRFSSVAVAVVLLRWCNPMHGVARHVILMRLNSNPKRALNIDVSTCSRAIHRVRQ